jgi:hypothetical protein
MEVVRHQAIGQDDPLPAARYLVEEAEKVGPVLVFPVQGLPVVPAAADVVDAAGFYLARTSGHEANVARTDARISALLEVGTNLEQTLNGV